MIFLQYEAGILKTTVWWFFVIKIINIKVVRLNMVFKFDKDAF